MPYKEGRWQIIDTYGSKYEALKAVKADKKEYKHVRYRIRQNSFSGRWTVSLYISDAFVKKYRR